MYLVIRDRIESFLASRRFRLDKESLSYGSFASAELTYVRGPLGCPNFCIELHWDGQDLDAWITYLAMATAIPGVPNTRNLETGSIAYDDTPTPSRRTLRYSGITTVEQAEQRARELTERLAQLFREVERARRAAKQPRTP